MGLITSSPAGASVTASPGHTTYYVNGRAGNDGNPGTSPGHAWKSVARVNQTAFAPGDRVLLAGGQTFPGTLRFTARDSGAPGEPIVVSSYGPGWATVDAGAGDGFVLTDCAHVTVQDLNFAGCGRKRGSDGAGLRLTRTRHVEVARVEVRGFRLAGVATGGDVDTRLTHIHARENGFAGITAYGGHDGLPRTRNLYIADCLAEDNPGDPKNLTNHSGNGIVVGGADGVLIEYCEARNNGWDMPRRGNGPVGIWGWDCDRLTIQHCISHDNKSPGEDGGGFDFDGGVTNSVMQYNLSYHNQGTGFLLCQYPGAPVWKNNVVRYNISMDDGAKNLHSGIGLWIGGAGISDARIYNNTVVNPAHAVATLGDVPGMVYRNNVFVAGGGLLSGDFTHSRFENNLYWMTGQATLYHHGETRYETLAEWAEATGQETTDGKLVALFADPRLTLPGHGQALPTEPRRLAAMPFFRLRPGSPCLGAGVPIAEDGGRDLFGNALPGSRRRSLGAHEPGV